MKKVIAVLMAVVIICGVFAGGMMVGKKETKNNDEKVTVVLKEESIDDALINYLNNIRTDYVYGTVDTVEYWTSISNGQKWIRYFGYEGDEIVAVGGVNWNHLESTLN